MASYNHKPQTFKPYKNNKLHCSSNNYSCKNDDTYCFTPNNKYNFEGKRTFLPSLSGCAENHVSTHPLRGIKALHFSVKCASVNTC